MSEQYTYAVARIHAMEDALLSIQDLEKLLSCSDGKSALEALSEMGYDCADAKSADEVQHAERERLWRLISELVDDMSVFNVFLYETDFHNLKAAIKLTVTHDKTDRVFIDGGTVPYRKIADAVENREYSELPKFLRAAALAAAGLLYENGDGGLCDVIIDKAYLEMLRDEGKRSDSEFIRKYAELTVALTDIRIAARGCRLGKSAEFFGRALAGCETLNVDLLGANAAKGFDEFCEYLSSTDYAGAAETLAESYTAFEKWCDDRIMEEVRRQKHNYFTVAPIAAYLLAKEAELKAVGLILTGKQNRLDDNIIKERLRELYV